MPGPLPKRTDERRRRNKVPGETTVVMTGAVVPPALPTRPAMHQVVRDWYESLKASGQSQFYEPSDWSHAVITALMLNKLIRSARPKAEMWAQCQAAMRDLLTTESARRRMRLFVTRNTGEEPAPENVTPMQKYERDLG